MTTTDSRPEVLAVVRRINDAWHEGPPSDIVARVTPCFDADAVMCGADFKIIVRGADACAKSYEDFVRMATVQAFAAPDPEIHVAHDTATAACPWTMTYTLNGETYTESGHDILVFRRDASGWRVTWRAMLPAAS